jgi:chemotaxis protein CheY-P-specific phosphatase CheC
MNFDKKTLISAAEAGSKESSKAFSKLSGEQVTVSFSEVEFVSFEEISDKVAKDEASPIIAYVQLIKEISGVSILSITREQALIFVDLLNKKPVGSTGVLMDIDRSAIKETLNILSNSFLNALSKKASIKMITSDPHIVPSKDLSYVFSKAKEKANSKDEKVVLFKTALVIAKYKIKAELYLIFNGKLLELFEVI